MPKLTAMMNILKLLARRFVPKNQIKASILNYFHKYFYYSRAWANTYWLGIKILKSPLDLWVYQEILFELQPDIIIECGSASGGSALFYASICDIINRGRIISIDIEERERPIHERIKYLIGSSISAEIIAKIKKEIKAADKVLVSLDSDHHKDHVLSELKLYSQIVTKDSYLIVEDTNINGHPVVPKYGPGPMEALEEFLKENNDFIIDRTREKYYLTFHPNGFLLKIK